MTRTVQAGSRVKVASAIARVLLGLLFTVIGLNGFLLFMPPPPTGIPPNAMAFSSAMFASHYVYFTAGVQVLAGILLLANRYVLFALILLAAVLVNILAFHITMWPQTLFPMPIVATILWFLAAWSFRAEFYRLFTALPQE
jgi:predicted cobalt transporter CbtA